MLRHTVLVCLFATSCSAAKNGARSADAAPGEDGPGDLSVPDGGPGGCDDIDRKTCPDGAPVDDSAPDARPPDAARPDAPAIDAAAADATPPDAMPPDAMPRGCVTLGDYDQAMLDFYLSLFPTCPPAGDACSPGGSCSASHPSAVSYASCTTAECSGSAVGSGINLECHEGVTCSLSVSTSNVCALCGINGVCTFADSSTGTQRFRCEEGSDCTLDLTSNGDRTIDCTASMRCRIGGSALNTTRIDCGPDCVVDLDPWGRRGMKVCCPGPEEPAVCPDGRIICGPTSCS